MGCGASAIDFEHISEPRKIELMQTISENKKQALQTTNNELIIKNDNVNAEAAVFQLKQLQTKMEKENNFEKEKNIVNFFFFFLLLAFSSSKKTKTKLPQRKMWPFQILFCKVLFPRLWLICIRKIQ